MEFKQYRKKEKFEAFQWHLEDGPIFGGEICLSSDFKYYCAFDYYGYHLVYNKEWIVIDEKKNKIETYNDAKFKYLFESV